MPASSLADVQFVVDENLLGVGAAIAGLRSDTACVGQAPVHELLPSGILDPTWIPIVGERGWIMVTDDKGLRTRPAEAQLAIDSDLQVIHLFGVGHLNKWDQLVFLTSKWPQIERHLAERAPGCWWLSVRSSVVRPLKFQPGAVDRTR